MCTAANLYPSQPQTKEMQPITKLLLQVSASLVLFSTLTVLLPFPLPHDAVILLPSLFTSSAAPPYPFKAIFILPALLASPSQAASLRPGFNMEYFKRYHNLILKMTPKVRVRKRPATAADLAR